MRFPSHFSAFSQQLSNVSHLCPCGQVLFPSLQPSPASDTEPLSAGCCGARGAPANAEPLRQPAGLPHAKLPRSACCCCSRFVQQRRASSEGGNSAGTLRSKGRNRTGAAGEERELRACQKRRVLLRPKLTRSKLLKLYIVDL